MGGGGKESGNRNLTKSSHFFSLVLEVILCDERETHLAKIGVF